MEMFLTMKYLIVALMAVSTSIFADPDYKTFPQDRFVYTGTDQKGTSEYLDTKSYESDRRRKIVFVNFYYDATKDQSRGFPFAIIRHRIDCNKLEQTIHTMATFDKDKKMTNIASGKQLGRNDPEKFDLTSKYGEVCAGAFGVKV